MNNQFSHSASNLTIDDLLRETFITVLQLRAGTATKEGSKLYQVAKAQIERVQDQLRTAQYSDAVIADITYAQCALLDEAVMNRHLLNSDDNAYQIWIGVPLQIHFFNTLEAGEALYQRIQTVLSQVAPDPLVLACFHRVLLLGFMGKYGTDPHHPERQAIFKRLDTLVQKFGHMPMQDDQQVLLGIPKKPFWLLPRRIRVWVGLSMLALGIWGMWHLLDNQLRTQLAEAIPTQAMIMQQVAAPNTAELSKPTEVITTEVIEKTFSEANNKSVINKSVINKSVINESVIDEIVSDTDLNSTQLDSVQQTPLEIIQIPISNLTPESNIKFDHNEPTNSTFMPALVVHPSSIGDARE